MLPGLVSGIGLGLGAYLIVRGIFPPPRPLAVALARMDRGQPVLDAHLDAETDRISRLRLQTGSWVVSVLEGLGFELGSLRRDLRVVGRTMERHALDKVLVATVFSVLPVATAAVVSVGGVTISTGVVIVGSVVLGVAGFMVPDLSVRGEAERRRRNFGSALAAYLDLVAIIVAGGGGVETALYDAADAGRGWAFAEIRRTLEGCRLAGEAPWVGLQRLGAELGVDELRELAASVGLAAERGAQLRTSLAAKAGSLRDHQLTEIESEAQAATEKMSIPVVLLLFGFLAFVLYPALTFVVTAL